MEGCFRMSAVLSWDVRKHVLRLVNRIHQPQRFLVRQDRLLHLVHHVGETDLVLRIGEGVASARAGMAEGSCSTGRKCRRRTCCIFHQPGRERDRNFKNAIEPIADGRRH